MNHGSPSRRQQPFLYQPVGLFPFIYIIVFQDHKQETEMTGLTIQEQIQEDWENREYIEKVTMATKKLVMFLNNFDIACKSRLAGLDTKITTLEQKVEFIEAHVAKGETLS